MEQNNDVGKITLHMIPLEGFIEMLQMLWDNGADYVDITAQPNVRQDVITLNVRDEYIDPEYNTFEMDPPSPQSTTLPVSSINLNDLA